MAEILRRLTPGMGNGADTRLVCRGWAATLVNSHGKAMKPPTQSLDFFLGQNFLESLCVSVEGVGAGTWGCGGRAFQAPGEPARTPSYSPWQPRPKVSSFRPVAGACRRTVASCLRFCRGVRLLGSQHLVSQIRKGRQRVSSAITLLIPLCCQAMAHDRICGAPAPPPHPQLVPAIYMRFFMGALLISVAGLQTLGLRP